MEKTASLEKTTGPSSERTAAPPEASARDLRCDCGKLLARVLHAVVELKCSRCKRVVLVVGGRRFEAAGTGPCSCPPEPSPVM